MKKEVFNNLGNIDQIIVKAYEKGLFDKKGVSEVCRELAEKNALRFDSIKKVYYNMKNYGFFKLHYPEKFKVRYMPFGTRLTESNFEKLKQLRKETGETTQTIINELIEKA